MLRKSLKDMVFGLELTSHVLRLAKNVACYTRDTSGPIPGKTQ